MYNQEHRHSGLNFLTSNQRHDGQSSQILAQRKKVYEEAKPKPPEGWSRSARNWTPEETVWLNPDHVNKSKSEENCSA